MTPRRGPTPPPALEVPARFSGKNLRLAYTAGHARALAPQLEDPSDGSPPTVYQLRALQEAFDEGHKAGRRRQGGSDA